MELFTLFCFGHQEWEDPRSPLQARQRVGHHTRMLYAAPTHLSLLKALWSGEQPKTKHSTAAQDLHQPPSKDSMFYQGPCNPQLL